MLHTIGESHAWRIYEQLIPLEQIHYYEGVTLKRVGRDENADLHNWVAAINLQPTDALIFVFGEIDIRVWAHVHDITRGKNPGTFLVDWVDAYLAKIKTAPANGARLVVQAIIPPGTEAAIRAKGKDWPVTGSDIDRAMYAAIANCALKAGCQEAGLGYLDVYARHLGPGGMIDPAYTDDGVHLNTPTLLRELLIEQGLL